MHNRIHQLNYGRLVCKCLGYVEDVYVFSIRGNLGDLYKTDGISPTLVSLQYRGKELTIRIMNDLVYPYWGDLGDIIKTINSNWVN